MTEALTARELPEVMFFLPHLGGGGAEMNAVRISRHLPEYGFKASFAVCRGPGPFERFLDDAAVVSTLPTGRVNSSTLRLVRGIHPLRRLLRERQPAVLCAVMDLPSLIALLAVRKLERRPRVVLSIQNSPRAKFVERGLFGRVQLALLKRLYPAADHIIALSKGVAEELVALVPSLEGKISVVHNAGTAVESNNGHGPANGVSRPPSGKLIVACGRLVEQKGYPYLLKAFSRLLKTDDAHLWIVGEGPQRRELEQLAESLSIAGRVRFLGFQDDPQRYMRNADVFVLSSLWEGFGNVIVEAMATGTAVVATDCPHGPAEIITHEQDGMLVPPADDATLARTLSRVLRDDDLRRRIAERGLRRALDFSPDTAARQYAAVFSRALTPSTI